MYGGLNVETPSRVLKRALLLERAGAELDNLPGLPDSSTDDDASDFYREPDSSLVHTPAPPTRARHGSRPPEDDGGESTARTARVAHRNVAQRPRMAELGSPSDGGGSDEGGGSVVIHDETGEETDQSALDDIELVRSRSSGGASPDALAHVQTRRPASRLRRSQHADGRVPSLTSASSTSSPSSAGIGSPAFAPLDAFPTPPGKDARAPDVSIVAAESEHEASLTEAQVRAEVPHDYQPSPLRPEARLPSPPDTPLSVDYSNRPAPSNYATPRPLPADSDLDAERRKTHLLSALRVTAVRSAARAKMKAGTPHPRGGRTLHALSPGPAAVRAVSEEDEDEPAASASDATSNDLTTHGRANASQPIGETVGQDRFNGVKLNAYMSGLNSRLTKENEALGARVDDLDAENRQLRRRIGLLEGGEATETATIDHGEVDRLNELLHQRDVRVAELEERLQHAPNARPPSRSSPRVVDALQAEITELKERLAVADPELAAEWQERADELLIELEARDAEIAELRDAGIRAEDDFSDRLAKMERASCSAIEEVERQLADSRMQLAQLERERQDIEAELQEARGEVSRLAHEDDGDMMALREERDRLRTELDEVERSDDERVVELNAALAERDERLRAAEARETALLDEADTLRKAVEDERRRVSSRDQTVAALRLDATNAANDMSGLRSQLTAAATARSAPRPDDGLVADLEAQLHAARREVARLRAQPTVHASDAGAKELEIEALRSAKDELEHRVASLRRQQTAVDKPRIPSGSYTSPDASVARPPLPSIHTPKTPGQMARDWTTMLGSPSGNETISPLLAQIHELELQLERLQRELRLANSEIDDKIAKLDSAGAARVVLGRQLASAQARTRELESRGSSSEAARRLADAEQRLATMTADLRQSRKAHSDDRAALLRDLGELEQDLRAVRTIAEGLGLDIASVRRLSAHATTEGGRHHSSEEVQGLLAMLRFLKARVTREAYFRADLAHQKAFMALELRTERKLAISTRATLARYGLPTPALPSPDGRRRSRRTLKAAAFAVLATVRMSSLARSWSAQVAQKTSLRSAYAQTRGKPWPV